MKVIKDKLIEPYEVQLGGDCITVGIPYHSVDKEGNPTKVLQKTKYFSTLEGSLKYLIQTLAQDKLNDVNSLKDVLKSFKETTKELNDLLDDIRTK